MPFEIREVLHIAPFEAVVLEGDLGRVKSEFVSHVAEDRVETVRVRQLFAPNSINRSLVDDACDIFFEKIGDSRVLHEMAYPHVRLGSLGSVAEYTPYGDGGDSPIVLDADLEVVHRYVHGPAVEIVSSVEDELHRSSARTAAQDRRNVMDDCAPVHPVPSTEHGPLVGRVGSDLVHGHVEPVRHGLLMFEDVLVFDPEFRIAAIPSRDGSRELRLSPGMPPPPAPELEDPVRFLKSLLHVPMLESVLPLGNMKNTRKDVRIGVSCIRRLAHIRQ